MFLCFKKRKKKKKNFLKFFFFIFFFFFNFFFFLFFFCFFILNFFFFFYILFFFFLFFFVFFFFFFISPRGVGGGGWICMPISIIFQINSKLRYLIGRSLGENASFIYNTKKIKKGYDTQLTNRLHEIITLLGVHFWKTRLPKETNKEKKN